MTAIDLIENLAAGITSIGAGQIWKIDKDLGVAILKELAKIRDAVEAEQQQAVKTALEKVRTEISKLNKSANDYYKTYADIGEEKHAEYWRGQAKGTFDAIKRLNDTARLLSESTR